MKGCSFLTDPEHWRARAAATRLLANQVENDEAKKGMLEIVSGYEETYAECRTSFERGRAADAVGRRKSADEGEYDVFREDF
jgi:hypothetical protein